MPIDPISVTSAPNPVTQSSADASLTMGKDAFLKMMIENLRNQDPSSASDNKEWVQQLSQMTMLEQMTNMATATATLATETRDARAVGMLGKTVGWVDKDGIHQEGVVDSVDRVSGTPMLKVGPSLVDPSKVTDVH